MAAFAMEPLSIADEVVKKRPVDVLQRPYRIAKDPTGVDLVDSWRSVVAGGGSVPERWKTSRLDRPGSRRRPVAAPRVSIDGPFKDDAFPRRRGMMAKAKDPVCGMTVDTERAAARGLYRGETVYFCSVGCQRKYEATHPAP